MKEKENIIPNSLTDREMLADLRKMLDAELAPPYEERDYDAIKEITAAMAELADDKMPPLPSAEEILGKAAERKRKKISHIRRWATALSACFVIGFAANVYTLATYGENLIETVLRRTRSGYSIDMAQMPHNDNAIVTSAKDVTTAVLQPTVTVTTTASATDAGGNLSPEKMVDYIAESIRDVCLQYGVDPFVPSELPAEMAYNGFFRLKESHHEELEDSDDFEFVFANGNQQQFKITLERYHSGLPEVLIPSDNDNYLEGEENGTHVYAFPNRNRVTAIFVHGDISYTINTYNVSADAVMQLAYSFVPSDSGIK